MILSMGETGTVKVQKGIHRRNRVEVCKISIPGRKGGKITDIRLYKETDDPVTFEIETDCYDVTPLVIPMNDRWEILFAGSKSKWAAPGNCNFYLYCVPLTDFKKPFTAGFWIRWLPGKSSR